MRNLILALPVLALAGCAGSGNPDASQIAFAAVSAFNGAELAITAYEAQPSASPAVKAQLKTYEAQAYNTVQPIVQQAASGTNVITAAEATAAQAAVQALTNYLTEQGIKA